MTLQLLQRNTAISRTWTSLKLALIQLFSLALTSRTPEREENLRHIERKRFRSQILRPCRGKSCRFGATELTTLVYVSLVSILLKHLCIALVTGGIVIAIDVLTNLPEIRSLDLVVFDFMQIEVKSNIGMSKKLHCSATVSDGCQPQGNTQQIYEYLALWYMII